MRRFLAVALALTLLAAGVSLGAATVFLVQGEILPSLPAGSLSIESESMILNRVWRGNEIYLLLAVYAVGATALTATACIMLRRIFFSDRTELRRERDE